MTIFISYFHHWSTDHFVFVLYSGRNNTTGNNVFISWCWKQGSSRVGLGPEYQRTGQGVPCYNAGSIFRGQTSHRRAVICGCSRTSSSIQNFLYTSSGYQVSQIISLIRLEIILHISNQMWDWLISVHILAFTINVSSHNLNCLPTEMVQLHVARV